jgi:hypothetical protein
MKTPRISDFDPDAKARALKSPLEGMPVIEKPSPGNKNLTQDANKPSIAPEPAETAENQSKSLPEGEKSGSTTPRCHDTTVEPPVPPGVPLPVRGSVPRTPKIKRPIRQRQPFDIFEDQYTRLKQIADAERSFVDGRGMSQMVREAIDRYLEEHFPSKKKLYTRTRGGTGTTTSTGIHSVPPYGTIQKISYLFILQ